MYNSPLRDSSLFIFALCSFLILHLSTLHFFYCFFCFFNFLHNTLFSCCICFSCTFFSGFSCCTLSLASRCSFYHYCITSFNKACTIVERRSKSCLQLIRGRRSSGSLTMDLAGKKAKRLPSGLSGN